MKFPVTIDRSVQVICILSLLWGLYFVRRNFIRTLIKEVNTEISDSSKNDDKPNVFISSFQESLSKARSSRFLSAEDKKLRDVFRPFTEEKEQFIFCEDCGAKNKSSAAVCSGCGAIISTSKIDSDEDGMPDYWEIKYKLDPSNSDDAHHDPDKDSRDNLQEFKDDSNPLISDAPGGGEGGGGPFKSELSFTLLKTYNKPIQILFMGYIIRADGIKNVQINWGGKTEIYDVGDEVRGYVIKDFQKIVREENDKKTGIVRYLDDSYIICQKKQFPPKTFHKEKLVTDTDIFAKIEFSGEKKIIKEVYIDSVIEDAKNNKTYTVTDISLKPPKIVIKDNNNKVHTLVVNSK